MSPVPADQTPVAGEAGTTSPMMEILAARVEDPAVRDKMAMAAMVVRTPWVAKWRGRVVVVPWVGPAWVGPAQVERARVERQAHPHSRLILAAMFCVAVSRISRGGDRPAGIGFSLSALCAQHGRRRFPMLRDLSMLPGGS